MSAKETLLGLLGIKPKVNLSIDQTPATPPVANPADQKDKPIGKPAYMHSRTVAGRYSFPSGHYDDLGQ